MGQGLHLPGRLEQALLTGSAVGGRRPALSQPGPRRRATRWPGERSATPKAPYASVRVTPSDFHSPCAYRVWLAALQLPCALPSPDLLTLLSRQQMTNSLRTPSTGPVWRPTAWSSQSLHGCGRQRLLQTNSCFRRARGAGVFSGDKGPWGPRLSLCPRAPR